MSSNDQLYWVRDGVEELEELWRIAKAKGNSYSTEKSCDFLFPFLQGINNSSPTKAATEQVGEKNIASHYRFSPLEPVPQLPEDLKQIALSVPSSSSIAPRSDIVQNNMVTSDGHYEDSSIQCKGSFEQIRLEVPEDSTRFPSNCQLQVVRADVKRSLWDLYPESNERDEMRRHLTHIILRIMYHSSPIAHYSQGMNDLVGHVMFLICSFREKVIGIETSAEAAARLSDRLELTSSLCQSLLKTLWYPFAQLDLEEVNAMSYALHILLSREDRKLWKLLQHLRLVQHPHYVLSWMLTWFMAGLSNSKGKMVLLMHFLQGNDALEPIYLGSALLLSASKSFQVYVKELMKKGGMSVDEIWGLAFQKLSSLPSAFIEKGSAISDNDTIRNKQASPSLDDSPGGPLHESFESHDTQIMDRIQLLVVRAQSLRSKYEFFRTEELVIPEKKIYSFPFSLFMPKSKLHKKEQLRYAPRYYCKQRKRTLTQHIAWYVLPLTIMTVLVLYNRYQSDIQHIVGPIILTYASTIRARVDSVVCLQRILGNSQNVTS